jgi:signal transduction histidine kinase
MNQQALGESTIRPDPAEPEERLHLERAPLMPGRWLGLARLAWLAVALLSLGLYLASLSPLFVALQTPCVGPTCLDWQLNPAQVQSLVERGVSLKLYAAYFLGLGVVIAMVYGGVAGVIFWYKSEDWLALLGSLTLLTLGLSGMNDVALAALVAVAPIWKLPVSTLIVLADIGMMLFFCLFPNRQFVPGWTRWLALGWLIFRLPGIFIPVSPFDTDAWPLAGLSWSFFMGGLIVAQLYRYRNVSSPTERQQTKWTVFGLALAIGGFLVIVFGLPLLFPSLLFDLSSPYTWAAITLIDFLWLLVPLAIGSAILRYRLWDIDLIINRTLVYSALTASVAGLYVLVVGGFAFLFHIQDNLLISFLVTALVALLFAPLRDRLQQAVNRLLYGRRDEPYAVLSQLGQRLEATLAPGAVLPTIVATLQEALKLPYVAVTLDQEGLSTRVAAIGTPRSNPLFLPLTYQGETIGQLILAPRAPGEPFSPADLRLLDDLVRQVGVAVHAVRLTADLQRSRERLVTAREEERRRLRRDLHDGLGPALAAHTLKLGSARALLQRDPATADTLMASLETDIQTSLADIRRLVYNLRPPSLDELGLLGAIRESAAQYGWLGEKPGNGSGTSPLQIVVEAPERLPPLPAAVEVAAYRIVQEALTNVVRHAQAKSCRIQLSLAEMLSLEITDDGQGLPLERRPGVGLASMRERAQELGGSCQVETRSEGGVRVLARLPLPEQEEKLR